MTMNEEGTSSNEDNNIAVIESEGKNKDSVILKQYELICRNVEYLDSNLLKIIGGFSVIDAALLANVNKFKNTHFFISVLIVVVGLLFCLMLKRTADLIEVQMKTIHSLEQRMRTEDRILPSVFGRGMSISTVSIVGILIITVITVISVIFQI